MFAVNNRIKKGCLWPVTELWFPRAGDSYAIQSGKAFEIVRAYHCTGCRSNLIGKHTPTQSLVSDLSQFDSLRSKLHVALRRDIDRALRREDMEVKTDWTVDQFHEFFVSNDPNNPGPVDRYRLNKLAAMDRLRITAMLLDGRPVCAHAYLEDFPRTLLLHTYTARKGVDRSDRIYAAIGRANKALHYNDMEEYSSRSFSDMDWGGFWGKPGYGPDEFKRRFRGELVPQMSIHTVLFPGRSRIEFEPTE